MASPTIYCPFLAARASCQFTALSPTVILAGWCPLDDLHREIAVPLWRAAPSRRVACSACMHARASPLRVMQFAASVRRVSAKDRLQRRRDTRCEINIRPERLCRPLPAIPEELPGRRVGFFPPRWIVLLAVDSAPSTSSIFSRLNEASAKNAQKNQDAEDRCILEFHLYQFGLFILFRVSARLAEFFWFSILSWSKGFFFPKGKGGFFYAKTHYESFLSRVYLKIHTRPQWRISNLRLYSAMVNRVSSRSTALWNYATYLNDADERRADDIWQMHINVIDPSFRARSAQFPGWLERRKHLHNPELLFFILSNLRQVFHFVESAQS